MEKSQRSATLIRRQLISERQSKARKANEDRSGPDRIESYGDGILHPGDRTGCVPRSKNKRKHKSGAHGKKYSK